MGVEVSLWVAEQFAADVTEFVPGATATAVSANQLVGGDQVYFAARDSKGALSLRALALARTVVLVLSQSGQTFPALKATARLCNRLGDRVFVMVRERRPTIYVTFNGGARSSCQPRVATTTRASCFVFCVCLRYVLHSRVGVVGSVY